MVHNLTRFVEGGSQRREFNPVTRRVTCGQPINPKRTRVQFNLQCDNEGRERVYGTFRTSIKQGLTNMKP